MATRFTLKCARESSGLIPLPNLCIGTWAWGDSKTWNNDSSAARQDLDGAWACMQKQGLNFVDTAEFYGSGESERIIRSLRDASPPEFKSSLVIASKFLPIPWPLSRLMMPSGMVKFCRESLERLGLETMDLYQIHGPVHFVNSIDSMASGLAQCVEEGLTKAVGVSNYSRDEMIKMDEALKKRGMRLASNQVEFSLLRTLPSTGGLLEECKKRGILMMAYSPLGMGRLSGKYTAENPPPSGRRFSNYPMEQLTPLLDTLHKVAGAHGVKPSAVALKWVIQKGAIPLGGVKNAKQAEENAHAASDEWSISDEEMAELEKHSIVGTTSIQWQHG
ncbi:NADP-dependent oxidoreductase domain-containing protein [Pseudomassariella vexata]|uniref:NADP-dependent oxidoreductase domain-containing protein n=1 Tax=Pseudomassariella vexata TaxID=1141098 RepID=A0A1Y2EB85_9PEZI|nr:NADP-dependent oxidoreductase domain-containing protein [Pseudomassariella vexata]ORY68843.1 NADP-dependent oxidoreductase domain-containing protein [Pseudomassariella vexata]